MAFDDMIRDIMGESDEERDVRREGDDEEARRRAHAASHEEDEGE